MPILGGSFSLVSLVDAVGSRCRWTGRRDQLNSHQHDYDHAAGEQRRSITSAGSSGVGVRLKVGDKYSILQTSSYVDISKARIPLSASRASVR